jgi:hypothetical protein
MGIPLPVLLAMIVLLLWPAARLSAVLIERPRTSVAASSLRRPSMEFSWGGAVIGITTVAGHLMLLMIFLGGVFIIEAGFDRLGAGDQSLLFGVIPLKSLFRFVDIVQFSAFTIYASIDTRRALRANAFDQRGASTKTNFSFVSLVGRVYAGLKADLPVYLSAPVLSVVLLLLGIGLLGHAAVFPAS